MRNAIPWAVAFADVAAVAAYIAGLEPMIGQVAGLALKLLLVPVMLRSDSLIVRQMGPFLILAMTCLISIVVADDTRWTDVVATLGFIGHFALTLMLVREEFPTYVRAVTYLVAASALLYVGLVVIGQIPTVNGRLFYFHGLHPNLGSEIAAAAAICGVISLPYTRFIPVTLLLLANTMLMQGRAAMIAVIFTLTLRTAHEIFNASDSSRVQLRVMLATPLVMIVFALAIPHLADAMLLDNRYRGLGTGLVGRTDQWVIAWEAFLDRPFFGNGLGWFERTQELGAHNFFFYGLAEMGFMSIILFAMLARMAVTAYRIHGWKVVSLASVLAMFMMNDRFVNLNPYPFLVWVMFFALSARPATIGAQVPRFALSARLGNAPAHS